MGTVEKKNLDRGVDRQRKQALSTAELMQNQSFDFAACGLSYDEAGSDCQFYLFISFFFFLFRFYSLFFILFFF